VVLGGGFIGGAAVFFSSPPPPAAALCKCRELRSKRNNLFFLFCINLFRFRGSAKLKPLAYCFFVVAHT